MPKPDENLGVCAVCATALVRNRRDKLTALPGIGAPKNVGYPEIRFDLVVVWCPVCGLVYRLESSDLQLAWQNPEAQEARQRQAKPASRR